MAVEAARLRRVYRFLKTVPGGEAGIKEKGDILSAVDSKKLEHGRGIIYAGFNSFFGLGSKDDPVPTLWLLQ